MDVPELKSTQDIDKYADFIVTAISTAILTSKSGSPESQPVSEESLALIKEKRRLRRQYSQARDRSAKTHINQLQKDPDDYKSDMDDDHDLVPDIDCDTLIRIVKFLKQGKTPGPITYTMRYLG